MSQDDELDSDNPYNAMVDQPLNQEPKKHESSSGRKLLQSWLNRSFRIVMTDGRILIGVFLCTDADANVILGATQEYMEDGGEKRFLGLVMVPGRHIVSMEVDVSSQPPPARFTNENEC